jgi:hypothetical protein
MELGGSNRRPPGCDARRLEKAKSGEQALCSAFVMIYKRLQEVGYAGICSE